MTAPKYNATLPEAEITALQQAKLDGNTGPLIIALRDAKWPLRAIATGLGCSRMSVQVWEKNARQQPELVSAAAQLHVTQLGFDMRGSGVLDFRKDMDVPAAERERLAYLASQAKRVRRWTPPDAEERRAATELDSLLIKYVEQRGITPMAVSRHAGVTRRAIVARLERVHAREEALV